MKTLAKQLLALVSPVLIYFSYFGSSGATNLLYAWTGFGLLLALIFLLVGGLVTICVLAFNDKERLKHKSAIESVRLSFFKCRKFTFHTFVDIGCMVFYVWTGWWVLFFMEFLPFCIVKGMAFLTPDSIE